MVNMPEVVVIVLIIIFIIAVVVIPSIIDEIIFNELEKEIKNGKDDTRRKNKSQDKGA